MDASASESVNDSNYVFSLLKTAINLTVAQIDDLEVIDFNDDKVLRTRSLIISRKRWVHLPRNPKPRLSYNNIQDFDEWSELNSYINPVRIVISATTLNASLQIFGIEKERIGPIIKLSNADNEERKCEVCPSLIPLLQKVSSYGLYRLCEGFTEDELSLNEPESSQPNSLVIFKLPFYRMESPNCTKLILPGQSKDKLFCQKCSFWLSKHCARNKTKRKLSQARETEPGDNTCTPKKIKRLKTDERSRRAIAYLTPRSSKKRISNIIKRNKSLKQKVSSLEIKLSKQKIVLSEQQNKEMSQLVKTIVNDPELTKNLDDIVKESGDLQVTRAMKQVWNADRHRVHQEQTQAFFKDQIKNKIGAKGNSWSMISYRLALAVYVRSPAAFSALQSFNILKLPSESSLKIFTTARLQKPGMNNDYIEDQAALYKSLKEEQKKKGLSEPRGAGVLVFDEVRVISKIMWNSSNNELQGLSMRPEEYGMLTDIYASLKGDEDSQKATDYILQFYWRDASFHFDVRGPYITSTGPIKKDALIGCIFDVIQLFELNDFQVRALVCDGASTNLSVIKELMCVKGCFGYEVDEFGCRNHDIKPSFQHPFKPFRKIHFIICPSHQLKSMIAALYSSKPKGSKLFEIESIQFGWNAILQVYNEEIARSKRGEARRVKGLIKSFVERDSWTRLNVKPAKIMQQEQMLTALISIAQPENKPPPPNADEILMTREYLRHTKMIFEDGLLCNNKGVELSDHSVVESMMAGYTFFKNWLDGILDADSEFQPDSPSQKKFLSWQTWDLLRVTVFGFINFANDFLSDYPDNFILPVRINGSAIESVFGQMRYSTASKLSGTNYAHAQRNLIMKKDIHGQKTKDQYRGVPLAIAELDLKKKLKDSKKKEKNE